MKLKAKFLYLIVASMFAGSVLASPWPVGVSDEAVVIAGRAVSIDLISNDIGDNLFLAEVNNSSFHGGRVTINADKKSVTYQPNKLTNKVDHFWYVLKDDQGRTNAAKVILNISDSNWPKSTSDSAESSYGSVTKIPVLANDVGIGLKLVSVNEWSTNKGRVWLSSNHEVSYQQVGESRGDLTDSFWYVFEDKWGRKNAAKVVISIKEEKVNPWPTATPDFFELPSEETAFLNVITNDVGSGLRLIESNEWTQKGGKTRITGNTVHYTRPSNYIGTDAFWYVFEDQQGRTNSAKVEVKVGIEISQDPEVSVVEFCGNYYATDGTAANTYITSLAPSPLTDKPTIQGSQNFEDGFGRVNGRRYYFRGSVESGRTLWIEVDGVASKLVEASSNQALYVVGSFNNNVYYVNGNGLFVHDGNEVTGLGDLVSNLGVVNGRAPSVDAYTNFVSLFPGENNAFYFYVNNIWIDGQITYTTYWRVGDDQMPVKIGAISERPSGASSGIETYLSNFYYFNGLDYFYEYTEDFSNSYSVPVKTVRQQDTNLPITNDNYLSQVTSSLDAATESIVENNGRLFVIAHIDNRTTPGNVLIIPGKLYTIDSITNDFVKLATCESDL